MKLVIAGSSGFVGTELIRQALAHPEITSVVALGRRETQVPSDVSRAKLKSVICNDFENYPQSVKDGLAGADACIWTIAVKPLQSISLPWEQTCKVSRDYAVTAIKTLAQLPRSNSVKPLRFIYMSGSNAVRDAAQKPFILGNYSLMRAKTEALILDQAKQSKGIVEASIAKPGLIYAPDRTSMLMGLVQGVGYAMIGLPKIDIVELSAALLSQAVNGIDQETLSNQDLITMGKKAVEAL
ncbi:hypothetical protein CDD82_4315 [Ophiocordyceps australis]|uniref:3-beta hydroxysteroid dehydrogenase/isomerase domain-containing protein n=1 Tax=Ophiocordyceps australis TaxID=1399860 RepID=A0A2C5Z7F6_9HYPO|nr:hypothetical protein CDD82_4315 [Ophiocordyceps australis]